MKKTRIAGVALAILAATIALGAPAQATYHGKPAQILFARGGDIWGVQPSGKHAHRLLHDRSGDLAEPSVSPNGKRIAFEFSSATQTAEIFTSDFKGHHLRWITKKPSRSGKWLSFHGPSWSPNGKRIAFECDRFEFHGICTMSNRGGKIKVLYRCGSCAPREPDWGKGDRIVFVHGLKLWTVRGHGGHAHRLHIKRLSQQDDYGYQHPSWKPNGKTIIFSVGDTNTAVDTVSAGGGSHKRIIQSQNFGDDPTDYDYPVWSPNGKKVALHVSGNGPRFGGLPEGLYLMNPDGTGLKKKSSKVRGQYPQLFWATK
jgi:Tol biopolymer transport system component